LNLLHVLRIIVICIGLTNALIDTSLFVGTWGSEKERFKNFQKHSGG
jgi:hypothetical protein